MNGHVYAVYVGGNSNTRVTKTSTRRRALSVPIVVKVIMKMLSIDVRPNMLKTRSVSIVAELSEHTRVNAGTPLLSNVESVGKDVKRHLICISTW